MKKENRFVSDQKINKILHGSVAYKNGNFLSGYTVEEKPYPHQQEIINYMQSCEHGLSPFMRDVDEISGEFLPGMPTCYHDDVLKWGSHVPYYMGKYNVRLPEEYENHFLRKIGVK